ncbi:MAG: hypothetical protein Fur0018_27740 [Anaerolineales bacterium]
MQTYHLPPLLLPSLAFVGGVLLAAVLPLTTAGWALACALAATPLLLTRRPRAPALLFLLALGGLRYALVQPEITPQFIAWYNDTAQNFVIEGWVAAPPEARDSGVRLRVRVERLRPVSDLTFTPVDGLLLARLPLGEDWHYGERIRLEGSLETPPEGESFSYRAYLARQGIHSLLSAEEAHRLAGAGGRALFRQLFAFKARALQTVYRLWPDPEASLLAGILLGVESGIPAPVQAAFKETGTSHVIAISGFNITIVAGLFVTFFGRWWGAQRGALLAVLGIGVYTLLVGADAAVVRAAIMGAFTLFARLVGRRQSALNTLALTAALMTALDPFTPWDIGFQLSFAATLGLVLFADPLTRAFERTARRILPENRLAQVSGWVSEYVLMTLAAQFTTFPVMAYHFGALSWVAFFTNPVILPVQPPIMTLGGLAMLLGTAWLPLGRLTAPLVWPFVLFTIRAVEFFAGLPGGQWFFGEVPAAWIFAFYGVLFAWTFGGFRGLKERLASWRVPLPAPRPMVLFTLLVALNALVWRAVWAAPDGRLHLTLLDVGYGEALLLRTPGGHTVLLGGGERPSLLSDALGRQFPLSRRLDALIVAAPYAEHLGALPEVLPRFPPAAVYWLGPTHATREARLLQDALRAQGVEAVQVQAGQVLDFGDGVRLQAVAVTARGGVLLLTYGNLRTLLPFGLDADTLEQWQAGEGAPLPVNILLLAGEGYAPLNPPAWVRALQPQVLLLSAGDNPYGLPDDDLLTALDGYNLLRTDQRGWIDLASDGERLWVRVERQSP